MRATRGRLENRRRWAVAGLALTVLAVALLVGYRRLVGGGAGPRARPVGEPRLVAEAATLAPGLHLLGGLEPSAAYAIETSEGLVLVDSGLDADAGRLKAQLAALGLDGRPLRAILLTHVHGDHCGGAEALRRETGAKVYAGRGDAAALRAGAPRVAFFSIFPMPGQTPHPTTVDVELTGGEALDFGDVQIRAIAAPGHTPGSICYLLERGGPRALFAGDVITVLPDDDGRDLPGRKALGTYSTYLTSDHGGDASAYLATLRRLLAMPVPELVLPGHPRSDPSPRSPRLSQRAWETMLDAGIREMETLLARYEADGADFLDGRAKRLLPDVSYLGDLDGVAVYALTAGPKLVLVNAPGGSGLGEFVRTQLAALKLDPVSPAAVLLTSCDLAATSGLASLIEECHPRVVAPKPALRSLRESCPSGTSFLAAEDLPEKGGLDVTSIPLRGRGTAPAAYRVARGGKSVLFTGSIPILADEETAAALFADFRDSRGEPFDYLKSLMRLRVPAPDLWLPASPTHGQNANLYDKKWHEILDENWDLVERNSRSLRPANH